MPPGLKGWEGIREKVILGLKKTSINYFVAVNQESSYTQVYKLYKKIQYDSHIYKGHSREIFLKEEGKKNEINFFSEI